MIPREPLVHFWPDCMHRAANRGGRNHHRILPNDDSEAAILTQFWGVLQPTDIIIGHNVANFDLPFIKQRSCIHGIKPSRKLATAIGSAPRQLYRSRVVLWQCVSYSPSPG